MAKEFSRRGLLAASALLVPRLALPLAGAGALAFAPRPAQAAVDPATVAAALKVAGAAMSLYRMSLGSGPGITALMRQQTEMLNAIQLQLGVVQGTLNALYGEVEQLRRLFETLPDDTARTIAINELAARRDLMGSYMREFARTRDQYGIVRALHEVDGKVTKLQVELQTNRSDLMRDLSVLTVPAVCAAWYAEFEMHVVLLDYNERALTEVANDYLAYLDRMEPQVDAKLHAIEAEAEAAAATVAGYGRLDGYRCFTDGRQRRQRQESGRGGPPGEPTGGYVEIRITASRKLNTLSSKRTPLALAGSPEAETFEDLREAGLRIPSSVDGLILRHWSHETIAQGRDSDWISVQSARRQQSAYDAWVRAAPCSDLQGVPAAIAARENALTAAAQTRTAEALVYYSLKLCCRDARASVERTLAALQTA